MSSLSSSVSPPLGVNDCAGVLLDLLQAEAAKTAPTASRTPDVKVVRNAKDGLDEDGGLPPTHADGDAGAVIPSKIKYVMVLVKENHTFDNYFTDFPGAESSKTATLADRSRRW